MTIILHITKPNFPTHTAVARINHFIKAEPHHMQLFEVTLAD